MVQFSSGSDMELYCALDRHNRQIISGMEGKLNGLFCSKQVMPLIDTTAAGRSSDIQMQGVKTNAKSQVIFQCALCGSLRTTVYMSSYISFMKEQATAAGIILFNHLLNNNCLSDGKCWSK